MESAWPFTVPFMHALNKSLLCASVVPEQRDLVMRVADVGFLGALGGFAALTSISILRGHGDALGPLPLALVHVGFGHTVFESIINGIVLPLFRNPEKGAHTRTLSYDIWLHHILAGFAFAACIASHSFIPQAVLLTATECTAGLPSSFQEARKAKRASGALSLALAVLMLLGFAARCALSAAVVFDSDAYATIVGIFELVAGRSKQPLKATAQGLVWVCAVGLGALNCLWFGKVLVGAAKVVSRSVTPGKNTPVPASPATAYASPNAGSGPWKRRQTNASLNKKGDEQ